MKSNIKILSLILAFGLSFMACDDDDPKPNPEPPSNQEEAESAFLLAYGVSTPGGFITYMEVSEDIPSESNINNAVELGDLIRVYTFGENPFTWNADNSTLTRWSIDKTTLEPKPDGLLSFVDTGIEGSRSIPIFVSETEAYFTNLIEGSIVEWNPTTMEIVEELNVEPLPVPDIELDIAGEAFNYTLSDGKILMGVVLGIPAQCCEFADVPGIVAVFDPATGTLQYNTDNRMHGSESALLVDENNTRFVYTHFRFGWARPFFNYEGEKSPATILRLNDDGSFDPNFFFDAAEVLPVSFMLRFGFVFDNKVQMIYADDSYQFPDSFDDRNEIFAGAAETRSVLIDFDTKEVTPFTAFDKFTATVPLPNPVDGSPYFWANDPDFEGVILIRQDGATNFTEVTKLPNTGRVWNFSKLF